MGRSNTKPLNKTISKANYTAVPVDGLPEGWRVEIGTPESGNHSGRKDKCYIAPVTGNKCYSKGDVSRYLESGSKQERSTVPETHIQESSVIKTHVGTKRKKDALDGLPPGWTVDIRARKSGTKTKYDPYYTDPGTGYIFRSKRDVLRYLKTGKLGKYAKRTKKLKQWDITTSAYVLQEQGNLLDLVDPILESKYSKQEALKMLNIGLLCTNPSPSLRPAMSAVVSMLGCKIPVQAPLVLRGSMTDHMRMKAFEKLSQDSETQSLYSHDSQTQSMSMAGPWVDSSISTDTKEPSSSTKLMPDLDDVDLMD